MLNISLTGVERRCRRERNKALVVGVVIDVNFHKVWTLADCTEYNLEMIIHLRSDQNEMV